ncbi:hypothetical protein APUTEX25_001161, partial [Auxenochlorella protothecoides]
DIHRSKKSNPRMLDPDAATSLMKAVQARRSDYTVVQHEDEGLIELADHHLQCFLGSKLVFFEGGLDRMLAPVQEDKPAAAKRGNTVASKAGTRRRRGKEPVPVADPSLGITPDQVTTSKEPDTEGLDSATGPRPVDSSSDVPPLLSIPDNPAPSPESDPEVDEKYTRLSARVLLVLEKGAQEERDALCKYLVEADLPVLPA